MGGFPVGFEVIAEVDIEAVVVVVVAVDEDDDSVTATSRGKLSKIVLAFSSCTRRWMFVSSSSGSKFFLDLAILLIFFVPPLAFDSTDDESLEEWLALLLDFEGAIAPPPTPDDGVAEEGGGFDGLGAFFSTIMTQSLGCKPEIRMGTTFSRCVFSRHFHLGSIRDHLQ